MSKEKREEMKETLEKIFNYHKDDYDDEDTANLLVSTVDTYTNLERLEKEAAQEEKKSRNMSTRHIPTNNS